MQHLSAVSKVATILKDCSSLLGHPEDLNNEASEASKFFRDALHGIIPK